jgi:hypothetical protein
MKSITKIFYLSLIYAVMTSGQNVNVGADFVSRYVWRGLDIANSPSLQPTISISMSNVEVGFWGAYSLFNDKSTSDEIDSWIGYSFNNDLGEFSFIILDYYYPNAGRKLSNLTNGDGAHTLEGMISYSGPLSFLLGCNFYNDPGNNIYIELGYPIVNENLSLNFFIGVTPGSKKNPGYYGADDFSFINVGVKVAKEIKISDNYKLPVFSALVINPNAEIAHLVFGISL